MAWIRVTDEEGRTPKATGTGESYIGSNPTFGFTASVRTSSRRLLITVGNPMRPDVRWILDVEAQWLDMAR
jgi:hypothetical protein